MAAIEIRKQATGSDNYLFHEELAAHCWLSLPELSAFSVCSVQTDGIFRGFAGVLSLAVRRKRGVTDLNRLGQAF